MYYFSNRSLKCLNTCHPDLIKIAKKAIKYTDIDFGIAQGKRSLEDQKKFYAEGKSKLDGINKRSKHQGYPTDNDPSYAFDIYAYVNGASWDERYLSYLGGVIMSVAKQLLDAGEVEHKLRWGGNWDQDGEIITDQDFDDLPHFFLE